MRCLQLPAADRLQRLAGIGLEHVPDSNVQEYAASCNRLAELEFDALLPGHHLISLRNGRRHAEAAARDFNRIGLPKDLLR